MKKGTLFNQVPVKKMDRNFFDLSHEVKLSCRMGKLIPFYLEDVIPGDIFKNRAEIMARMAPMLAPIMHRVDITTHYFFVPNRLIWDEWETFITGGPEGTSAPIPPYVTVDQLTNLGPGYVEQSTLWDYMGLPTIEGAIGTSTIPISSLPFRAYTLIYDEYYRDQNVQPASDFAKTSGAETNGNVALICNIRNRYWEKDYFTSALPWTQRGLEATLPFEINYLDQTNAYQAGSPTSFGAVTTDAGGGLSVALPPGGFQGVRLENIDTDAIQITVNELRRTVRLQEWLEANARGGARYTEQIFVHFNERVPDYRLQRPEYLGGSKQPFVISEVLSTAANSAEDNGQVGDLAGHGLSVGSQSAFSYRAVEHGWILGLMSIMPKPAYMNGVQRKWLRNDKFDYFWKEFANIGEQAIKNMELFYTVDDDTNNEATFGYTPRYAEYKYSCDRVSGQFRTSLDYWHLTRQLDSLPTLNTTFLQCDAYAQGLNRIFYVTTDIDNIWVQIYNHSKAWRKMPYFGVPTI